MSVHFPLFKYSLHSRLIFTHTHTHRSDGRGVGGWGVPSRSSAALNFTCVLHICIEILGMGSGAPLSRDSAES